MNFGVASPWSDNDIVKVFQYNKKQRMRSSVLNDLSLLKAREVSNVTICLALNDDDNAKSWEKAYGFFSFKILGM